jgi:hypothetical protein
MSVTTKVGATTVVALMIATAMALSAVLPAAASDTPDASGFAEAVIETEAQNLAHVEAVAAAALTGDNISCRVEAPALVSQPEIDGRVTVKGEDTAAASAECIDLMLQAQDLMRAEMTPEFRKPNGEWIVVDDATTPGNSRMIRGAGVLPIVVDFIYPANDPSQGLPHRACYTLFQPKSFPPLCTVFLSTSLQSTGPLS